MLIDWFTVIAQTLNFLILVWLLKRFLYQPILDAIDAREKRIADELAAAATKQQQAVKQRDDFQQKNAEFDQKRQALLQQATAAAETEHQRLLKAAQHSADELAAQRQLSLQLEQQALQQQLREQTQQQVFAIARKTLSDLSNKTLESAMVAMFMQKLNNLPDDAKAVLTASIKKADNVVCISSTFALSDNEHATLQQAVNSSFALAATLRFESSDKAIAGITLSAGGQRIAWTIDAYLSALEKTITQRVTPPSC